MSNFVFLDAEAARDATIYGNKAANLAAAVGAGFAVPHGVCVPFDMPDQDISLGLPSMMTDIEGPWVARSSSVAEDSPNKSYAGIFETILGVDTLSELIESVMVVRMSRSTERQNDHRGTAGTASMGVLIQRLVRARAAGVAFTSDPVALEPMVIIEASMGLGKSVVDGTVTPDMYEFFPDGTPITTNLGVKRRRYDYEGGQIRETAIEAHDQVRATLSEEEARRVFMLAKQCEKFFGYPVDIEWAMDHDASLWLLQSRPITTIGGLRSLEQGGSPHQTDKLV